MTIIAWVVGAIVGADSDIGIDTSNEVDEKWE